MSEHHRGLERAYALAPVSIWMGTSLEVGDGTATVRLPVRDEFHHAAGAVHGSLYFRALDDAAFFAANSQVPDVFVLTASFNLHFFRPVSGGSLTAEGRVVNRSGKVTVAEAGLVDADGNLLAHGVGSFVTSAIPLGPMPGYLAG